MKLSEAIRAGSKIRPQAFGGLYETREVEERVGWFRKRIRREKRSCAWGAALEAQECPSRKVSGGEPNSGISVRGEEPKEGDNVEVIKVPDHWPIFVSVECPQCKDFESSPPLLRLIAHLNDDHQWTREQIACFVERIETAVASARAQPSHIESEDVILDAEEIDG